MVLRRIIANSIASNVSIKESNDKNNPSNHLQFQRGHRSEAF